MRRNDQNARLRLRFDVDVKGDLPEHAGGGHDTDLAPLQPVQNDLASFVRQDGNRNSAGQHLQNSETISVVMVDQIAFVIRHDTDIRGKQLLFPLGKICGKRQCGNHVFPLPITDSETREVLPYQDIR